MKLDRVQPTKIEDMNIGELEFALFQRLNARSGGMHFMVYTTFALIIVWLLQWWILAFFVMLFWLFCLSAVLSINADIKKIRAELNDIYGVKNE